MRFLRRLEDERGMALALAILMTVVLTVSVAAGIYVATANESSAGRSKASEAAYSLAEYGINRAAAILGDPANNALQPSTLPSAEPAGAGDPEDGGTYKYWGVLDTSTQVWTIHGKGIVANPARGAQVTRTISATVQVTSSLTQPLNNQAWNYIFNTKTGDPDGCDVQVDNSIVVAAPMYVMGNLCLNNSSSIMPATVPPSPAPSVNLVVHGSVTLANSSHVGTSGQRINQALIAGGCNGHSPCRWNGGGDPVWAQTTGTTPPTVTPPTADWAYWFQNASPGPKHPCVTQSGTPPTFDNEPAATATMNNSVPTVQNLTPASSYTCQTGAGELSWNAATRTLTVSGVIFVDGSITVNNGATNNYNGQASLYARGTFNMSGTNQLCGGVVAGSCDFGAWNPNTELLIVAVYGSAGGYSATFANSVRFQGGVYATNAISVANSALLEGPIVASNVDFANSTQAKPFPVIDTVPQGTPGNPNVHAQPGPPGNFSG